MRLSSDVLFGLLSERYDVDRLGRGCDSEDLPLPTFWQGGIVLREGAVYVCRTEELPRVPAVGCVFVCVGPRPSLIWSQWRGDVFYISDSGDDLLAVFNVLQEVFDRISTWEVHMQELANTGSDVRDMVRLSIPIFENRITIVDYSLRVLAYCEYDKEQGSIDMSSRFDHLPPEKLPQVARFTKRMMLDHEPFFFEDAPGLPSSYCVNLFFGGAYVGCCSLQEDGRPLRPCDLYLFQQFADYVRQALGYRNNTVAGQLVTPRAIFEQLLECFPVSRASMDRALDLINRNLADGTIDDYKWCCTVIRSGSQGKNLPERYLCEMLEGLIPNSFAFLFDENLVSFGLIRREEHRSDTVCQALEPFLSDMNLRAGVSRTFRDPFHARDFYLQALCALDTGYERDPEKSCYLFGDYVLDYMLQNCCGTFRSSQVIAPEFVRLRNCDGSVDYIETLRVYLDNDCNASKAAREMYLHRSTLVARLEQIRKYVDLDSPERRLYLRICLHLPDVDWATWTDVDVEDFEAAGPEGSAHKD